MVQMKKISLMFIAFVAIIAVSSCEDKKSVPAVESAKGKNLDIPEGAEELFPAPPVKSGWGQNIMDTLVNELYKGSYESALNAARLVSQQETRGANNPAVNIIHTALSQPLTKDKVGSEGCIAHFNNDGEVISAVSTKVLDFRTGAVSLPKPYTPEELVAAAPALKEYRRQLKSNDIVILFSNSFRDAAIVATLTKIEGIDFAVQRKGKGAVIVMISEGKKVTLADDWIFYE